MQVRLNKSASPNLLPPRRSCSFALWPAEDQKLRDNQSGLVGFAGLRFLVAPFFQHWLDQFGITPVQVVWQADAVVRVALAADERHQVVDKIICD